MGGSEQRERERDRIFGSLFMLLGVLVVDLEVVMFIQCKECEIEIETGLADGNFTIYHYKTLIMRMVQRKFRNCSTTHEDRMNKRKPCQFDSV